MAEKKITIEKLAVIINKGFQGQMDYMEKKFAQVATKKELDEVKKDVKYIKENLDDAGKLTERVDRIENMLDMPAFKK
jgi:uncharacterized protein YllA (UPF0747 family)